MRRIRYSQSFYVEFATLLEQGVDRFGPAVVAVKRAKVLDTIATMLARHPKRTVDPHLGRLHLFSADNTICRPLRLRLRQ